MAGTNIQLSTKRLAIVKANARNVITVGIASFITVFCLIASKTVFSQNQYQARVTKAKEAAHSQLQKNITTADNLAKAYQAFVSTPTNVIGGNPSGSSDNDGDNAKIILDSLPSTYDFPALTSSLEKIMDSQGIKGDISGTDDQINQQTNTSSTSPKPVNMPFVVTASQINYAAAQALVGRLQVSIRPMQVDTLDLTGGNSNMIITITGNTYYQPGRSLSITTRTVQ